MGLIKRVFISHGKYTLILYCKGSQLKGIKLSSRKKEAYITIDKIRKIVKSITASMKSKTYRVRALTLLKALNLPVSPVSTLSLMWLLQKIVNVDIEVGNSKLYFVFKK